MENMTDLPIEQQRLIFEVVILAASTLEAIALSLKIDRNILHQAQSKIAEKHISRLSEEEIRQGVKDFFDANIGKI